MLNTLKSLPLLKYYLDIYGRNYKFSITSNFETQELALDYIVTTKKVEFIVSFEIKYFKEMKKYFITFAGIPIELSFEKIEIEKLLDLVKQSLQSKIIKEPIRSIRIYKYFEYIPRTETIWPDYKHWYPDEVVIDYREIFPREGTRIVLRSDKILKLFDKMLKIFTELLNQAFEVIDFGVLLSVLFYFPEDEIWKLLREFENIGWSIRRNERKYIGFIEFLIVDNYILEKELFERRKISITIPAGVGTKYHYVKFQHRYCDDNCVTYLHLLYKDWNNLHQVLNKVENRLIKETSIQQLSTLM